MGKQEYLTFVSTVIYDGYREMFETFMSDERLTVWMAFTYILSV